MQHVYRLDEAATAIVATAADIARSTLAPHAAEVDARARFPGSPGSTGSGCAGTTRRRSRSRGWHSARVIS